MVKPNFADKEIYGHQDFSESGEFGSLQENSMGIQSLNGDSYGVCLGIPGGTRKPSVSRYKMGLEGPPYRL